MLKTHRIWKLWPDIAAMARDLDESPFVLITQREEGKAPDERHDAAILAKALYEGVHLRKADLRLARNPARAEAERERRRVKIKAFYEAAGGTDVVARHTGMTPNILKIAASRGRLPKSRKHEVVVFAEGRGLPLDHQLFEAITA